MVENQIEQILTNLLVKAQDQRPFRQIQELKQKIQNKIKSDHVAGSCASPAVATWPQPGRGNVAFAAFRGFVKSVGGAFAPPIFVRSPMLGFAYKY